ncbi:MAG TPA: hypothetical protein VLE22_27350 [Bryobacteraceae bacterium]|nr:hypothetical protein [Bryobacteraceae bacterium]
MASVNTVPEGESAKARNAANALLVALLLIAVLCVLVWWWHQSTPPGLSDVRETVQPPRTAKPPEVAAPATRPMRKEEPQRAEKPKQPAFPTAESVPVGMEKSELLARFGKPNMVTTSVEQGQEMETLVYLRRGPPKKETVLVLRNGSVVSVNSVNP